MREKVCVIATLCVKHEEAETETEPGIQKNSLSLFNMRRWSHTRPNVRKKVIAKMIKVVLFLLLSFRRSVWLEGGLERKQTTPSTS